VGRRISLRKQERLARNEQLIKESLAHLRVLVRDAGLSRTARELVEESIRSLENQELSHGVRAANAISRLSEVEQDANLPFHLRTKIWKILSLLEQVRD